LDYSGEGGVGKITVLDMRPYLVYRLTKYQPHRIFGNNKVKLSRKNVLNVWVNLAVFFHLVNDELEIRQSNLGGGRVFPL
jgi:hypothetical protein